MLSLGPGVVAGRACCCAAVVVSAGVGVSSTALSSSSAGVGAVQWTRETALSIPAGRALIHDNSPACLPLYKMVICLPQIAGG